MGMRTIVESIPAYLTTLVELLRNRLHDAQFIARHRVRPEDFTRERQLTFPIVILFVLQKTIKSIHRHLHEFLDELAMGQLFEPVTAGAWTHARAKLKHTAFIELNQQVVLPIVNQQGDQLQRWHGHRLFGHDSSLIRLPDSPELAQEFGRVEIKNHKGATGTAYPEGRMSIVYDLLNRIGVDARLESSRVGEVSLAIEQSVHLSCGDVAINDRGYIPVDEHYRTAVPHIYAAGDVIGFPALASTSMEQGRVAVCHAFGLKYKERVASLLPMGIYTIPEISSAGETEESCKEKKIDYVVGRALYENNARGHITGDTAGMLKLIFARADKKLLGVSIIGENATELIHVGMMVLDNGLTIDEFIEQVFNYPTLSETYKYAAYDGLGNLAGHKLREG